MSAHAQEAMAKGQLIQESRIKLLEHSCIHRGDTGFFVDIRTCGDSAMCSMRDRWVRDGGEITSTIGSEPLLFVDRQAVSLMLEIWEQEDSLTRYERGGMSQ